MFGWIVPSLVKSIGYPYRIESLVSTHPSFLDFLQFTVIPRRNSRNGTNLCSIRNHQIFHNRILSLHTLYTHNNQNSRTRINGTLRLIRCTHLRHAFQSHSLGRQEQIPKDVVVFEQTIGERQGIGITGGGPCHLQGINDHVAVDDKTWCPGSRLFGDKGRHVVVGTSAHAFVGHDGHGGGPVVTEDGRQDFWIKDFIHVSRIEFALVFCHNRNGAPAFCECLLEWTNHFFFVITIITIIAAGVLFNNV
mmetsp:Transcript_6937/g.10607  ORF Transcript_6937/g.10607 Transcript_6937/m.10607 type:complete len:249 (-) Transcript_6937:155-901(-)